MGSAWLTSSGSGLVRKTLIHAHLEDSADEIGFFFFFGFYSQVATKWARTAEISKKS